VNEVILIVEGRRYSGWKSVRVTRSIESIAGSFSFEATDRWADQPVWPIHEEDRCRVVIDGMGVIDGYVDKLGVSISKDARTMSCSGRDRAAALVDCSAILSGWTVKNIDVAQFAADVAKPFGIRVRVQSGLKLDEIPKLSFSPGDSAFDVIRRVAGDASVLLVSDGGGGVVITRAGDERADPIVEGGDGITNAPILAASIEHDASERFQHYVLAAQPAATDEAYGDATQVMAGASDAGVRRGNRVLIMQPERGYNHADARRVADWEARTRAARGTRVSVTVQGWSQPNGRLWPINALTYVSAPSLGLDGDMLISQVDYSASESGQTTEISLVNPATFTPSPRATVQVLKATAGRYPELKNGAAKGKIVRLLDGTFIRPGASLGDGTFDPELVSANLGALITKLAIKKGH
jgi:prophage tail gpP-like protein